MSLNIQMYPRVALLNMFSNTDIEWETRGGGMTIIVTVAKLVIARVTIRLSWTNGKGCGKLLPCFPENKKGSYIIFLLPKMHQGLFSGDVLFFSCRTIYIYSNTVLSSSSGCCTRVEGRVSLNWGLFWGRAYRTSILKNHTRAYFQVRTYFQGNRVSRNDHKMMNYPIQTHSKDNIYKTTSKTQNKRLP